jgi:hypothetical protein
MSQFRHLMRVFSRLSMYVTILAVAAGCGGEPPLPQGHELITRARQAWAGDWHAVWQVEWSGAPVRGPLTAEVWHAADGRLRIETLEAPVPALSSLILVDDGETSWLLSRLHQSDWVSGLDNQVRIPLANDALDAVDWLLLKIPNAALDVSAREPLESGPAIRLEVVLSDDDRATLWIDEETGLPSRVELHSAVWGDASFVTRSISLPESMHPGLFTAPHD